MQKIFVIDWLLLAAFVLTAATGTGYHIAGNSGACDHHVWVRWAVTHILASVFMLVCSAMHVKAHWAWYKSLHRGLARKSRITLLLTILMIILAATGVVLLVAIDGGNSRVGLWHYRFSLAMTALAIIHIVGRWQPVYKSLK